MFRTPGVSSERHAYTDFLRPLLNRVGH